MIESFVLLWRERRGGEYRVIGGRDGAALRELLRVVPDVTVEEFQSRAANALRDEWFRRNGSIAVLCYQWSKWEPPRSGPSAVGAGAPGYRTFVGYDGSGNPMYRERS